MKTITPNFFIVGAAKAGTTTVYDYLNLHPEVYMSPIKEPHFFSKDIDPSDFLNPYKKQVSFNIEDYFNQDRLTEKHIAHFSKLDDYLKLFENSKGKKIVGEASTGYLFSQIAAKEIKKHNTSAKIIIILRDPLERILSHYYADVSGGFQVENNALERIKSDYYTKEKGWGITNLYIELSKYKEQVDRYLEIFNPNQILILDFKELQTDPKLFFERITKFLSIEPFIVESKLVSNQTAMPKIRVISYLHHFYQKHFKNTKINSFINQEKLKSILFKKPNKISLELLKNEFGNLLKSEIEYYKLKTQKENISSDNSAD